jgi:hypothetical protein
MKNLFKSLLVVALACLTLPATAGLADDVRAAAAKGEKIRPIVDGYIRSSNFSLDSFVSELSNMPTNGPVAVVYLVEHDAKYANGLVAALIDKALDTLVVSVVVAAKDRSPSMCTMVKSMAQQNKASATEAVVAVSTEAPSRANEAVQCASSEGLYVDLGIGNGETSDFQLEIQLGGGEGGGGDPEPPISPN